MHRSEKEISGLAHPSRKREAADKDGFRPDIEGLRGVAVSLVILFHAGLLSAASVQITGGFIGVDLFFVVSGFLITGLLIRERERTGKVSFARFYARRVRRILPAAAVTLLITIPLASGLVGILERPSAMEDAASAALSVANIRFAMTLDYFNPVTRSPFLHFWSLGVEEQFYFVWPALLAIVAWKWPRRAAGVALAVVAVVSFLASLAITESAPSTAFYLLPTRAWQLSAGGLLAIGSGSLDRLPPKIHAAYGYLLGFAGWAGLGALLTGSVIIDSTRTLYPGSAALIPTLAGVVLIASGTERTGPGFLLRLPPIRFLGKISYSLYLWHWPMLILGGLYLNGPVWQALTPGQAIALAGLSIPVATASWLFVEEPFRRGTIPLPRPSRLVGAGVAAMLAVAVVGTGFGIGAQSDLAALDRTDPTPSPTAAATLDYTFEPRTLAPNATPTPTPQMTPALTLAPAAPPPTTYAITSAIHPSIVKAPKDFEAAYYHCLGWAYSKAPDTTSQCVFGNPNGTYTVALVGDSHASALFPGVNEVAKAHGWKLNPYLKINCPFIDMPVDLAKPEPRRPYPECGTWNNNVVGLLTSKPPDLVLISMSRWIWPLNGANDSAAADANALIRQIRKLLPTQKVVIIQDPPLPVYWGGGYVPDCLAAHLNDYRACAYMRERGTGSNMGYRETTAANATGAGRIDLTSTVCPGNGDCPVVINNMIVWRDDHHFTATFSATLGPVIDAQLVAILVRWATPAPTPFIP